MSRKAFRLLSGVASALVIGLVTAVPAVAQYPPTEGPTGVAPPEGGEVAFTGADVTMWMVLVAGLVVAGILALVAARYRSKTTTN